VIASSIELLKQMRCSHSSVASSCLSVTALGSVLCVNKLVHTQVGVLSAYCHCWLLSQHTHYAAPASFALVSLTAAVPLHTTLTTHNTCKHNNLQGIDMSKSRGPTPLVRRNVLCIILHLITLSAGHHKLEPASIMTALALVMDTGESEGGRPVRSSSLEKVLQKVLGITRSSSFLHLDRASYANQFQLLYIVS
jgi:hypothetical protein